MCPHERVVDNTAGIRPMRYRGDCHVSRKAIGLAVDDARIFFRRDGETIRHFWGAELTYAPADPDRITAASAPLESRSRTVDLTPAGRPTSCAIRARVPGWR